MNLREKKIGFVVALDCPYGGNLIPSLEALARQLREHYAAQVFWVFPRQSHRDWLERLRQSDAVYFTNPSYSQSRKDLIRIFREVRPDLVHTHFSHYDIASAQAIQHLGLSTRMVWHLHCVTSYKVEHGWKGKLQTGLNCLRLYRKFGWWGRKAHLLAVSAETARVTSLFHLWHWPSLPEISHQELYRMQFPQCSVLINGMDMGRICADGQRTLQLFTFLSFGGREEIKRLELIVLAAQKVRQRYTRNFRLLFTRGIGTEEMLHRILGTTLPDWVEIVPETDDISSLFLQSSCYVSSSTTETMSTAVAEATLYKIPVIQSDIAGTYWNADRPSTWVFRNGDEEELAEKMWQVMCVEPEEMQKRCEETYRMNCGILSLDAWCAGVTAVYEKL